MKTYALSEDVGQAVVQYLSTRPYREVAQLVEAMAELPEINVNAPSDGAATQENAEQPDA